MPPKKMMNPVKSKKIGRNQLVVGPVGVGPAPAPAPAPVAATSVYQAPTSALPDIHLPHVLGALLALIIVFAHKLPLTSNNIRLSVLFVFYVIAVVSFYDNLPIVLMFSIFLLHGIYQYKVRNEQPDTE